MSVTDDYKNNPSQYKTYEQSSQGLNAAELAKKLEQLKANKVAISDEEKLARQLAGKALSEVGKLFHLVEKQFNLEIESINHRLSQINIDIQTYSKGILTDLIGKLTNSLSSLKIAKEEEELRLADLKEKQELINRLKNDSQTETGPSLVRARQHYESAQYKQCQAFCEQLKVDLKNYLQKEEG